MGLDPSAVSRIINGQRNISADEGEKILRYLEGFEDFRDALGQVIDSVGEKLFNIVGASDMEALIVVSNRLLYVLAEKVGKPITDQFQTPDELYEQLERAVKEGIINDEEANLVLSFHGIKEFCSSSIEVLNLGDAILANLVLRIFNLDVNGTGEPPSRAYLRDWLVARAFQILSAMMRPTAEGVHRAMLGRTTSQLRQWSDRKKM